MPCSGPRSRHARCSRRCPPDPRRPTRAAVSRCWLRSQSWLLDVAEPQCVRPAVQQPGIQQRRARRRRAPGRRRRDRPRCSLRPAAPASTDRANRCARFESAARAAGIRARVRAATASAPSETAPASPGTNTVTVARALIRARPSRPRIPRAPARSSLPRRWPSIIADGAQAQLPRQYTASSVTLPSARVSPNSSPGAASRIPRAHRHSSPGRLRRGTA